MKDDSNLLADQGSTECELDAMGRHSGLGLTDNSRTDTDKYGSSTLVARVGTYVQDKQREVGRSLLSAQGSTELRVGAMGRPGGGVCLTITRQTMARMAAQL